MAEAAKHQPTDKNADAFRAMLPKLVKDHAGKFALFHDGQFLGAFDSMGAAYTFAVERYGLAKVYIGLVDQAPPPQEAPALFHGFVRPRT